MEGARFQILSLSGGGYRGLYTASVLVVLEKHLNRPIGHSFEIIAGTSIGGIIALGVAFEVEMAKVARAFTEAGPAIFPRRPQSSTFRRYRNFLSDYRRPQYSAEPIREFIEKLFGKDARLRDAKHPLLIPTVNLTEGKPQVLRRATTRILCVTLICA